MPRSRFPFLALNESSRELKLELEESIAHVVASGQYIGGPEVEAFEVAFANQVGAKHCVGVGNGLDAISLTASGGVTKVLVPSSSGDGRFIGTRQQYHRRVARFWREARTQSLS